VDHLVPGRIGLGVCTASNDVDYRMWSQRQGSPPCGFGVLIHRMALLVVVEYGNDIELHADAVSGNVRLRSELMWTGAIAGGRA
jgi:hypothetical protein